MNENIFDKLDFGPFKALLDNDDITDISYDNNGQIWIRSLTQGSLRVEVSGATPEFVEKLAFQCSNVMGTTFNNAKPFLDAESAELRLNFVHPSIATNGIAMVIRKTPAKIRLEKEKLISEDYFTQDIHDILIKCVEGHCNIIVSGETGSGKTEFVKYLASHTKVNEKIITIEDTLELHLDKIFPQRDIVAMKTNNVASYTDVLVTCMRQNPKWILLSEVRSAEAVSAVRNSISSGHNILSTIHADKASAIPYRLYSLMETDLDVNQFLSTIYRYIQLGVHIRAYYSKERGKFHREVDEVVEFYVDENNQPQSRTIYQKVFGKEPILRKPSKHLIEYLENQNIDITAISDKMIDDEPFSDNEEVDETYSEYQAGPQASISEVGEDSSEYSQEQPKEAETYYTEPAENQNVIYQEQMTPGEISDVSQTTEINETVNNNMPLTDIAPQVSSAMETVQETPLPPNNQEVIMPQVPNQTVLEVPVVPQQMPLPGQMINNQQIQVPNQIIPPVAQASQMPSVIQTPPIYQTNMQQVVPIQQTQVQPVAQSQPGVVLPVIQANNNQSIA